MKVKMILPALTDALGPYWRSVKYSLFPPLGLATLAGHLRADDDVVIQDEHVQPLDLDDRPDLVVIEAYIASANRAYRIADHYRARGVCVAMGGLHVTALPREALGHADAICIGPGDEAFGRLLADFRAGAVRRVYRSRTRSLLGLPRPRRDLINRRLYLVPNTLVVSRGCPHTCDFCYKSSFFRGGRGYYTQAVDAALAEVDSLPGRHVYFLDDNLFGDRRFAEALLDGMRGMGRLWQAAGTVPAALSRGLMEKAARAGLRSLFVGFETLDASALRQHGKLQNAGADYAAAISRLHGLGVMVNGSFVFGMDHDDAGVFARTVAWAVAKGIETCTFHVLTPYPGTPLHARMESQGRILHRNWDLYDTRHAVFQPARMTPAQLEQGRCSAYEQFYRWSSIISAARTKPTLVDMLRHLAYTGAWKKCEGLWSLIVRNRKLVWMLPVLEAVLNCGAAGSRRPRRRLGLSLPDVADIC
jgi:radical SAM superfamily enzyme YgiQ (UPF0313 family)